MSLFSLIIALLLEQWQPLARHRLPLERVQAYADFFRFRFNAGKHHHGRLAWLVVVGLPAAALTLAFSMLEAIHPLLAFILSIAVFYLTLGFRRLDERFGELHQALKDGDTVQAASLLALWRNAPSHQLNAGELARVAIEQALIDSNKHVFGVIVWFLIGMMLGLGPSGAVIYRLSQYLDAHWGALDDLDHGDFGVFARHIHVRLEWLPVRLSSATFAVVGNFEDAVYCWRTQAHTWADPEQGILLASGAGALGVKLGQAISEDDTLLDRPELGTGDEAAPDYMQSTTGLIWRTLVFWLILLLLITLATLVG